MISHPLDIPCFRSLFLGPSRAILLTFIVGFASMNGRVNAETLPTDGDVSIITLIVNPFAYHNKLIMVRGYVDLAFDGSAVYLHRDDEENGISKNGIWLDIQGYAKTNLYVDLTRDSPGYARVLGVFKADQQGHMSAYSGTITSILRLEYLRDP